MSSARGRVVGGRGVGRGEERSGGGSGESSRRRACSSTFPRTRLHLLEPERLPPSAFVPSALSLLLRGRRTLRSPHPDRPPEPGCGAEQPGASKPGKAR